MGRWTAAFLGACLCCTTACQADAPHKDSSDTSSATVAPRRSAEPAAGIALAGRAAPSDFAGGPDGSLLLGYEGPGGRCYLRRIDRDGTVVGGLFPRCGWLIAHGTGFLAVDYNFPLEKSLDVTDPGQPVQVTDHEETRDPTPGDVLVDPSCGEISDIDEVDDSRGCAYSPTEHAWYRVRSASTIDPAGRIWTTGANQTITVTDAGQTWASAPLPGLPDLVLASAADTAAVWTETSLYVTRDVGRSWYEVTSLPDSATTAPAQMLPDGRLLLGPAAGQLWRATDASNQSFQSLPAGVLGTVAVAGDLLYGLGAGDARVYDRLVWVSADQGTTWRLALNRDQVVRDAPAVPADQLVIPRQPTVAALIRKSYPNDVAVTGQGLLLMTYEAVHGRRSAWRLYDRQNRMITEGFDGGSVTAVGDGFLLSTGQGMRFVAPTGDLTPVEWREDERRPVIDGDLPWSSFDVYLYRPSEHVSFRGEADPNGLVTAADHTGRMWALGIRTDDRTVVRSAMPGQAWQSRDLGPDIGARDIQGSGSILMVVGPSQMYLSADAGATWTLLQHDAVAYEGVPVFRVLPDGSILGGDTRGTERMSRDLQTFFTPPSEHALPLTIGDLFIRNPRHPQISKDGVHWLAFTPANARTLLAEHPRIE